MKNLLLGAVVIAVALAGCGKREEATKVPPKASVETPPPVASQTIVTTPPAPLPEVNVPPGESKEPQPKPGQANDHSSPAFKAGGQPVPQKQ